MIEMDGAEDDEDEHLIQQQKQVSIEQQQIRYLRDQERLYKMLN
jgi:hypothetical protein